MKLLSECEEFVMNVSLSGKITPVLLLTNAHGMAELHQCMNSCEAQCLRLCFFLQLLPQDVFLACYGVGKLCLITHTKPGQQPEKRHSTQRKIR